MNEDLIERMSLSGCALVVGAGSGICRAAALILAGAGAHVGVLDKNRETAEDTTAAIRQAGGSATVLHADATSAEDLERALDELAVAGPLRYVVNGAASFENVVPIVRMSEDQWDEILKACLTSQFLVLRAVAPRIADAGGGSIVNISSIGATNPQEQMAHYCAAKGGAESLTRTAAIEFSPEGIRVNCVRPGTTDTPGSRALGANPAWSQGRVQKPDELIRYLLGRQARPDEMAGVIWFLLSPLASYINGEVITVDSAFSIS